MKIIKQPPKIHTAFNPILLVVESENDSVILYVNENNQTIKLERDGFKNRVTFDLSGIVKTFFKDEIITISTNKVYTYKKLFASYSVRIENVEEYYICINSVSQIGYSSDLTPQRGFFLTDFEYLKKYEGYPLDVSCLGFPKDTHIGVDGNLYIENEINQPHFNVLIPDNSNYVSIINSTYFDKLTTNANEIITTNDGDIIYIRKHESQYEERRLNIKNMCLPHSPFYVRWINRQGGYDYWMFSHRQYKSKSLNEISTFDKTITDQFIFNGTNRVINLKASEKIIVGASILTLNEYECVSNIIYSPCIEYYDKNLEKWFLINQVENELKHDTNTMTGSLELTFLLPNPQLQF